MLIGTSPICRVGWGVRVMGVRVGVRVMGVRVGVVGGMHGGEVLSMYTIWPRRRDVVRYGGV